MGWNLTNLVRMPSVLNRSTLKFQDFSESAPGIVVVLDRRIFER